MELRPSSRRIRLNTRTRGDQIAELRALAPSYSPQCPTLRPGLLHAQSIPRTRSTLGSFASVPASTTPIPGTFLPRLLPRPWISFVPPCLRTTSPRLAHWRSQHPRLGRCRHLQVAKNMSSRPGADLVGGILRHAGPAVRHPPYAIRSWTRERQCIAICIRDGKG